MKFKFKTYSHRFLADTLTPVSIYLRLRDKYPQSILLESSDYHGNENSISYICFQPIAYFQVHQEKLSIQNPDGEFLQKNIDETISIVEELKTFASQFEAEKSDTKYIQNGLFGYMGYDSVRYFEDIEIFSKNVKEIPDIYYAVYQNIIAINHFSNEGFIICNSLGGEGNLREILGLLKIKSFAEYSFKREGNVKANISDEDYINLVSTCKEHCQRGDVFQIVPSMRFSQRFSGDEFNVYRALRSINPSPYLFYFDYGNFKIFGSSPEAQLIIKDGMAEIHPIAGTIRRTGNDEEDLLQAKKLSRDEKEKSEHVMLVDLARNDLSRNAENVKVELFREVQYFSHVIHLVSKVRGKIREGRNSFHVVADTFPAGTLTGAPKHNAMKLLTKYENINREFYGGAIGFMDFQGNFNHAIIIRSFLSKDHQLHYQAGAGVVTESVPENELKEVYNKVGALNKALELAEFI